MTAKVIAQQWISLDGYAEGPDGVMSLFGAVPPENDAETKALNERLLPTVSELLFGRRTYEQFVQYWPTADEPVASQINAAEKTVFSRSLEAAPWPEQPDASIERDAVAYLQRRKQEVDGNLLLWGSLDLGHSLFAAGLIDELQLFISPAALGQGTAVLTGQQSLELLESERWGQLIYARYRVR